MPGLLFYDPSDRTGEFYKINNLAEISLLKQHTNWRRTWEQIITGSFNIAGFFSDLLFYDPSNRTGEFYSQDGHGDITRLKQHTDWRRTWTHIIPGNFSFDQAFSGLLFYDPTNRTGEFYRHNGPGDIFRLKKHTNWRRTWTHIVPGTFSANRRLTDLFFYDPTNGVGEFYSTDGNGGMRLLKQHTNLLNTWTHIIPGNFAGAGSFTDLFFYEANSGNGEFYTTDGTGELNLLRQVRNILPNAKIIVPVRLPSIQQNSLFFYDPSTRAGEFRRIEIDGLPVIRRITGFRNSWTQIIFVANLGSVPEKKPDPPFNFQVTEISDRQVSLSWNFESDNVNGFRIKFSGKRASSSDHDGTKSVDGPERRTTLTALKSNFEYTISIIAFNNSGESQPSNEVQATTPARTISVSKEGAGESAVFIVKGNGFTPGSLVVIKATAPNFEQIQFQENAGGDGIFEARQSIKCLTGVQITFTAFEDNDPSGTFANVVVTSCP